MLLHMPQQLNNREMCKIVPWSDDHFSYKGNTYCPKILIMGSKTICEVHSRFVTGVVLRKLPATCNVYAATVWPVLVTEAISSLPHVTYVSVVIMSAMASRRLDGLLNCLFRCRSQKTSKLRVTGLCEGNSPTTVENSFIWWRHHDISFQNECTTSVSNTTLVFDSCRRGG